jgi:hypothetical protein
MEQVGEQRVSPAISNFHLGLAYDEVAWMLFGRFVEHFAVIAECQWVDLAACAVNYLRLLDRSSANVPRQGQSCIRYVIAWNQVHD